MIISSCFEAPLPAQGGETSAEMRPSIIMLDLSTVVPQKPAESLFPPLLPPSLLLTRVVVVRVPVQSFFFLFDRPFPSHEQALAITPPSHPEPSTPSFRHFDSKQQQQQQQ